MLFIPLASAMGLVDYVGSEGRRHNYTDYASMIQVFNRFVLDLLSTEVGHLLAIPAANVAYDTITQLFGLAAPTIIRCESCGTVKGKETLSRVTDLVYPRKVCIAVEYWKTHNPSNSWRRMTPPRLTTLAPFCEILWNVGAHTRLCARVAIECQGLSLGGIWETACMGCLPCYC
jgi:hypothetical protein